MKGLYRFLTTLVSDYSGVSSALLDLDGLVILHDAGGCAASFVTRDEPRWYRNQSAFFTYGLRELDAILGRDDDLVRKITDIARSMKKQFIALIGSPVSAVVGTDFKGIARVIQKKVNVPVLAFETTGFEDYSTGVSAVFMKIAKQFIDLPEHKIPKSVNILGATPLDVGVGRHLNMLVHLIQQTGFTVIASWTMNSTLKDIKKSAQAEMNIVISYTGLALAKYMKENHGIPYIVAVPVGREPTTNFIHSLGKISHCKINERFLSHRNKKTIIGQGLPRQTRALIIGEPVLSCSIRQCLIDDFGVDEAVVASLFPLDNLNQCEAICVESKDDLMELINQKDFHLIVGDPYYRELMDEPERSIFIPIPHIARSGCSYWNLDYAYIGEWGFRYFQKFLYSRHKKVIVTI